MPATWLDIKLMAKKEHISETPATQFLKRHKVVFSEHPYEYLEHGGALHSAAELGWDPFQWSRPSSCRTRTPSRWWC